MSLLRRKRRFLIGGMSVIILAFGVVHNFESAHQLMPAKAVPVVSPARDIASNPEWVHSAMRLHVWWLSSYFDDVRVYRTGFTEGAPGFHTQIPEGLDQDIRIDRTETPIDLSGIPQEELESVLAEVKSASGARVACRESRDSEARRCLFVAIWGSDISQASSVEFVGVSFGDGVMGLVEKEFLEESVPNLSGYGNLR